jgi:hypothetical protein
MSVMSESTGMSVILPAAHCDLELTDIQKGYLNSVGFLGTGNFEVVGRQLLMIYKFHRNRSTVHAMGICGRYPRSTGYYALHTGRSVHLFDDIFVLLQLLGVPSRQIFHKFFVRRWSWYI